MKKRIKKFVMLKGVEIFTNYVPTGLLLKLFPANDPIELLNGLSTAARITAALEL